MSSNEQSVKKKNSHIRLIGLITIAVTICLGILLLVNPLRFILSTPPVSSEMKSLVLEQDKIEFMYPENWFAHLTPQGNHGDLEVIAIATAPGIGFQNMIVARKQFNNDDLSVVADWSLSRIKSRFVTYEVDIPIPYSSEHFSGLISEYTATTGSPLETQNAHCKDLFFLHEQNGYAFSFCADESDWIELSPIFDEIMASIRSLE